MDVGIPRSPIFRTTADAERPSYDTTEMGYYQALLRWRECARQEAIATAKLGPEMQAVQRYCQALMGKYWDTKRAKYKSPFFDNRMDNARLSDLALLTDTKPVISVSSSIPAYKQQAQMASSVIESEWSRSNMDLDLVRVVDIAKLTGTGFWKLGAAFPGALQAIPCGPENVLPIQPGFDLQSSTAVLYQTWKSLGYFRNRFPFTSRGLERESNMSEGISTGSDSKYARPAEIPEYTWNGLSPQMRRALGVVSTASDMDAPTMFQSLQLQEFYIDDPTENTSKYDVIMRHPYLSLKQHNYWYTVKPGQRLYPRKRLVVFAGRKPVYDGPAPFWHGLYPFACMRLNPVTWSFWGLSKYRNLLPINEALNEIGAGIMDMIKKALNPTLISKLNVAAPAAWKEFYPDQPGGKLLLGPQGNPQTDVRFMDPPNIPAYVMNWHTYLSQEFDRIAGSIDVTSLGKKKQVPGGDTIEQMREMMNSITRLEGRYIEKFLEEAGTQAVSLIFQYFTVQQRMRILGAMGITDADFDTTLGSSVPDNVVKEEFAKNMQFKVSQGSLLSSAKDREKTMAIALTTHGLLPVAELFKRLEFPDPEGLVKELMQEREAGLSATGRSARSTRGQKNGQAA